MIWLQILATQGIIAFMAFVIGLYSLDINPHGAVTFICGWVFAAMLVAIPLELLYLIWS